jgi:hypothetical protein
MTEDINKLPIVDVIRRLEKYPKPNPENKKIIYKTDGFRIRFLVDGKVVHTD